MLMTIFQVSHILSQILMYAITDDTYFDSLSMVQIDNGLEMSLAKQYFDDSLVSIKQQDPSFSRTEKKFKSQHIREGLWQ